MSWKPLFLSASAGAHLPPVLISTTFTDDTYTILLTDLVHIWSESLNRTAILRRSRAEGTSIDPSSGDQFDIFFEKIKLGLEGGKDTTAALTVLPSNTTRPSFVLTLTVKLPSGLAPLVWPIELSAAPQALLTSRMIIPLMQAQHTRILEFEGLKEVVREKDHVIQKVVDKLEASGTEFGEVFPQAAGKAGRKVDRKKAEDRVRGMAVFDINAWRSGLEEKGSQDAAQLIGEIFNNDMAVVMHGQANTQDVGSDWWESIEGITINLTSGKFSTDGLSKAKPSAMPTPLKSEEIAEDDAFQVQVTSPRLTSPPKHRASSPDNGGDLGPPSQDYKIPDRFSRSQSPLPTALATNSRRTGNFGGKKITKGSPTSTANDNASGVYQLASRVEPTTAFRTYSPSPTPVVTRTKKTLGKIGGHKEQLMPSVESEPHSEAPNQRTSVSVKPKMGKLGQISGKKTKEAVSDLSRLSHDRAPTASLGKDKLGTTTLGDVDEVRGNASVKEEKKRTVTPPALETETERADRKRDALKRDLEEKAKAPVKKKRKF